MIGLRTNASPPALISLLVLSLASAACAEVQTFQITGMVTAFSAPDQPSTFGITPGDTFTGLLSYDPAQAGYQPIPDSPPVQYNVSLGGLPFFSFILREQEFTLSADYLNVYFHGMGSGYDRISTYWDGFDPVQVRSPFGDFSNGGLNQAEFTLQNDAGNALSDAALPSSLNLADWPTHYIRLYQAGTGGLSPTGGFSLQAELTSVVAVPEPGICGLATAAGALVLLLGCLSPARQARGS